MVNVVFRNLRVLSVLILTLCGSSIAYEAHVTHKSPREFKHAVTHYIKHTDAHYVQKMRRDPDENASYKKELRYLFKNYGSFSAPALLLRVRSAHQAMVKGESDTNSDVYKKYEQISSALLLVCAQIFCNDVRNQLLNALHDIDHSIMYWRYQQQHQLRYFFSKSPTKWIMGKSQAKEISYNLKCLEHKQKELYTILGALTGHIHAFTERDMTYNDCYTWMDELFIITSCIKINTKYDSDGTKFDNCAAQLNLKIKQVGLLKNSLLRSVASAHKPNHFVRNWIPYTVALAAAGYAAHYYAYNYNDVNKILSAYRSTLCESWVKWVINPSKDVWNTISGKDDKLINQVNLDLEKGISDFAKDLKELETKKDFNKTVSNKMRTYIDKDRENVQKKMKDLLDSWLSWNCIDQNKYNKIIEAEALGDIGPFNDFVLTDVKMKAHNWAWSPSEILQAILIFLELNIYHYGSNIIQIVFELITDYGIPVVKEALIVLSKGNKEWDAVRKKVNLILNVAVLTPTIIVGGASSYGLYKAYRWATARDYSPIRIALADVNSLLIESAAQLDNHDYGKLVYLICKLRHKATSLKDPLAYEFLVDVAKLESKQYDPSVKRGIVENMFNKYAFLGRIAI